MTYESVAFSLEKVEGILFNGDSQCQEYGIFLCPTQHKDNAVAEIYRFTSQAGDYNDFIGSYRNHRKIMARPMELNQEGISLTIDIWPKYYTVEDHHQPRQIYHHSYEMQNEAIAIWLAVEYAKEVKNIKPR